MTAKDAVKCAAFANDNFWTVEARMKLPDPLLQTVLNLIKEREALP
jgi:tetraacyldisaccharide-1-P 4'-kinase